MKKICIEVNYFENEKHTMKCPFCNQIIQNDEITDNGSKLTINDCPHTLLWAIDGFIEFQNPIFDEFHIINPDPKYKEDYYELFMQEHGEKLFLKGGYLDYEKNDNIIIYEVSDCSPGPFQSDTIVHYGFFE